MKAIELLLIILAMLIPFFLIRSPSLITFIYWNAIAAIYLIYIATKGWKIAE